MRSLTAFPCASETLIGSLDAATGTTGLLIVSGGNEVRCGAHRGMALLAERIAASGHPVFRYDRRGIGDSTGENRGFLSACDDLVAAAAAFRAAAPQMHTLVGYGNCDAASTLALHGRAAGLTRVLLANPWTIEDDDDLPPAVAIRATYRQRLTSPTAWVKLLTGRINFVKAIRGLRKAATKSPKVLAARVIPAIESWGDDAKVILASGDATAQVYRAAARQLQATMIDTSSHSFARAADRERLYREVSAILADTTPVKL
jgi:exosortase A-associated hydrolase 1